MPFPSPRVREWPGDSLGPVEALSLVPLLFVDVLMLFFYKRVADKLLASEARFGGTKVRDRARTEARRTLVRRVVIVWCLLFMAFVVGAILQST